MYQHQHDRKSHINRQHHRDDNSSKHFIFINAEQLFFVNKKKILETIDVIEIMHDEMKAWHQGSNLFSIVFQENFFFQRFLNFVLWL